MAKKKLRVKRKGFTTKKGKRVKPTNFDIKDRGAPGRGKKIFPTLKEGSLGVDFSKPARIRRAIEVVLAKKIGEKRVIGKLRAIQVLNKRTNQRLSEKARLDARFIASSFIGKKRVRTGKGLSKRGKK